MAMGGIFYGNTTTQTKPKMRVGVELQCSNTDNSKGYFFQIRYFSQVSVAATKDFQITVSWSGNPITAKDVGTYGASPWIDLGWYTAGQSISYSGSAKYTSSGTTHESKLSGTYTVKEEQYTIDFSANGGYDAPSTIVFTKGSSATIPSLTPKYTGRRFLYWNTDPSGNGVIYYPDNTYKDNASTYLYAIWEVKKVTVIFKANGGVGTDVTTEYTYGKKDQVFNAEFTKEGCYLLGWETSSKEEFIPNFKVTDAWLDERSEKTITLYAVWANVGSSTSVPLFVKTGDNYKKATGFVHNGTGYKSIIKIYRHNGTNYV